MRVINTVFEQANYFTQILVELGLFQKTIFVFLLKNYFHLFPKNYFRLSLQNYLGLSLKTVFVCFENLKGELCIRSLVTSNARSELEVSSLVSSLVSFAG